MDYGENICQAIDTIIAKRLSELQFDITDNFTIFDDSDKANGFYTVGKDLKNTFVAFGSLSYNKGDEVYITIPKGDWNETKFILGPKKQNRNRNSFDTTSNTLSPIIQTENSISYTTIAPLETKLHNAICIEFEMMGPSAYSNIEASWETERAGLKTKTLMCQGNNTIAYSKHTHYLNILPNDNLLFLKLVFDSQHNIKIKNVKIDLIIRSNYSLLEELEELKIAIEQNIKGGERI